MKPDKLQATQSGSAGGRNAPRVGPRLGAAILALVLVLSMAVTAYAYAPIDTSAETGLTVSYLDADGDGIQGVVFRLYRVADVSDTVELTLSGDFAGAAVDLDGADSTSAWNALASTLAGYAAAGGFAASAEGITDQNGRAVFGGLTVGLYLLVGDAAVIGNDLYTPAPSMILLPTLDDADEWDYSPSAVVKYEKEALQEYIDITVRKVWDDDDDADRPDSVTIELIRDGAVADTVTLDEDNGWKYTWTDLPVVRDLDAGTAYTYSVNEADVPDGYTVTMSQNGYVYTVTNTGESSTSTTTTPTTSSTPDSTLPQTGQLNWPIPCLVVVGLLLLCVGLILRRDRAER